ncbi:hypothetical protein KL930_005250 [Ogataea haglerorum]|uniref:FAD-binding domain-containing protein n=1 Tax=Ogataea haglerorum TaxID=1937702 RepID=A0AAN6D0W4_9ASCO|nr:hypothetical protein KL914_005300 [Ogataea haglerorum]KAG7702403.1 hypothetical protein KL950_005218 [Ogataea haglerorum]KAG7724038.1 hypothetical protein KL933_005181 [Ogataea haglerorum]KAG7733404.1 hypothetical protein KL932_005185 [Ogataea haglerorum]KAG7753721.1 hypothetical protein KL947_005253 [Ogataea haglerorum]
MSWDQLPILISGAGIAGLLTAQALKRLEIPFIIFDRDESVSSRGQGWGITLHWALNDFLSLLPENIQHKVFKCQVLEDFHLNDSGNFVYINAGTANSLVHIPPSKRLRVRREQIRKTLLEGIDVNWSCKTMEVRATDAEVTVLCENGRTFTGKLLIGAEGSNSATRRFTNPDNYQLYDLPVRFLGSTVILTHEEYEEVSKHFDSLLFQGTIPSNDTFFWFSLLSSPAHNGTNFYECQVNFSWNCPNKTAEKFDTVEDKINVIKRVSSGLNENLMFLRDKMVAASDRFMEIRLSDWPYADFDDKQGKIILIGDACHAMVMYRGEAGNHAIADVKLFINLLEKCRKQEISWPEMIRAYKDDVKERAGPAVLLSRQACLDAHNWEKLKDFQLNKSPLLALRKK